MRQGVRRKILAHVTAYCMFLIMVATVACCSVGLFAFVMRKTDGNILLANLFTVIEILFLSALFCIIGTLRSKITVDKPVKTILEATEKIAHGDFQVRLEPIHAWDKRNEFDVIIENINRMAAELSKTEILRADFIAAVSHEIKTPLSIIQNYVTALQDGSVTEEQRREYMDTLVATTRRLSLLISNILKLNKLENQQILPENRRMCLNEAIAESLLGFERVIERKHIDLQCDFAEDVYLCSDRSLLALIWNNLISNAVKFTDDGGTIRVTVGKTADGAVVEVADTGCGMSEETGMHIFDKFYQGDKSHAQEGNGLGLSLVKRVIDILGGEISVESKLGEGSRFTVRLRDGEST